MYLPGAVLTESYTFRSPASGRTSGQVATHTVSASGYNVTYTYTYDDNGNITSVSDGVYTVSYVYDSQNQLVRENNQRAGKTWTWEYDGAGNILNRKEYAYTTGTLGSATSTKSYTYGDNAWGDLLTGYNGKTITYDTIGNMLTYNGKTFVWEHGRQLAAIERNGQVESEFFYNIDGLRTGRVYDGTAYSYVYSGGKLIQMEVDANTLAFTYDAHGMPMSLSCNGRIYYYVTNLQGDVIAILNESGQTVVTYSYDAWGKILNTAGSMASTLGTLNPLRCRGYVYDQETGLYYVSSRYYDPEIGRFINADDIGYLGAGSNLTSYNLFAYCGNNPVMGYDPYGTFDFWGFAKGVSRIVTGIAAVAAGVAVYVAGAPVLATLAAIATIATGALTTINGVADIQQATTGNNFVRDTVFNGNQTAYDVYSGATETAAIIGTVICGKYISSECFMKGAVPGTEGSMSLEPGMTLDRYGSQFGRYLTDPGTHYSLLDLPASNSLQLNSYRVLKSFRVSTGIVANGGGFQYFSWMSVKRLIQFGFLELL